METTEILEKINQMPVQKDQKVALAVSGGSDSSLAILLLRHIYKAKEIVPIRIDVGLGEEEFSNEWLSRATQGNSDYNDYPMSTSMTRQLVARIIRLKTKETDCDTILEGSTGKENDQYRMDNPLKLFAPELDILVRVSDFNLTLLEEQFLCTYWGVPVTDQIIGSDHKTLWCHSIASGEIDLNQPIPEKVWMRRISPKKASDKGVEFKLEFSKGIPISLNNKKLPLGLIIEELHNIAGSHGTGFIDMFEDGIMDFKSRNVYKAPAAHVILKLHLDLEQQYLKKMKFILRKQLIQNGHILFIIDCGIRLSNKL